MKKDLGKRQTHHYYFKNGTMDFAAGWLLGYSQIGGLSVGEIYDCLNKIKDGNPVSWAKAFISAMDYQEKQALRCLTNNDKAGAGIKYLAAAHAARAALHMIDPTTETAVGIVKKMEDSFQNSMFNSGIGIKPYEFNFEGKRLPAYISNFFDETRPLYIVIGGGDTFREDLYFFGGAEAIRRGYNVLMVDLPGQGKTPYDDMHFGRDTLKAIGTVLDAVKAMGFAGKIILTAYSGGGYFTTKLLENEKRIDAWVASTPIYDMYATFEKAMPALLRSNPSGFVQKILVQVAGWANPVLKASLKKYNWQFGPGGLADVVRIFKTESIADYSKIDVPSLFLIGQSEADEAQQQAQVIFDAIKIKRPQSRLIEFPAESGADAHCQVNNLLWAQHEIFFWLESLKL